MDRVSDIPYWIFNISEALLQMHSLTVIFSWIISGENVNHAPVHSGYWNIVSVRKQSLCLKQHNKNRKCAVKKCVITEAILTARVVHGATDPIVRGWLIYQN